MFADLLNRLIPGRKNGTPVPPPRLFDWAQDDDEVGIARYQWPSPGERRGSARLLPHEIEVRDRVRRPRQERP